MGRSLPCWLGSTVPTTEVEMDMRTIRCKQGSGSPCDDALYLSALGWLDRARPARMFTPGDNDWTDCDRPANGGYDSLERLDRERQIFFSTNESLGRHTLVQEVQTAPTCLNAARVPASCIENHRWVSRTATPPSCGRSAASSSASAGPSPTCTATRTTSGSTTRCSTRTDAESRTSPVSRRSATTRHPPGTRTTCSG